MSYIRIDTNALRAKVEALRVQKQIIDNVLENFKGDSLKLTDYWSGDTGDIVSDDLKDYVTIFDYISNKLERYIVFLQKVAKAYELQDAMIIKEIEQDLNNSVF